MTASYRNRPLRGADVVLRIAIVALALATAYIHLTLGGQLFTLNAIGYAVGAAAMVAPIPIAVRYRWLVRIALIGYAATTIVGWLIQPTYYWTAYLAKTIELALIALLAIDVIRRDGNPIARMHRLLSSALVVVTLVVAACSSGSSSPTVQPSIDPDALTIAADDLAFSTTSLSAPADEPFQIAFDNQESAPHNVAIYRDSSASERVYGSDPFSGPAVVTYDVPPLAPATYFFRCDVHPTMSGQLSVG